MGESLLPAMLTRAQRWRMRWSATINTLKLVIAQSAAESTAAGSVIQSAVGDTADARDSHHEV